jgi:photosystem II stability/assembly factor-like uncharacterized protein
MLLKILLTAVLAALLALACYEPEPPVTPEPMWYWHNGPTVSDLYDLTSTARNDVWAVGMTTAGTGEILHFSAFRWTFATLPAVDVGPLYAVDAIEGSGDAWAAGGGDYFLQWDGSKWRNWPHPSPGKNVYGLAMVSDTSGWAVGEDGLIFEFDGIEWTGVTSPTTETLRRVRVVSKDSAWAVGDGGTVLHYDGSSWEAVNFPPSVDLRDLSFLADDDGWVVGAVASLYHYDGATFTRADSPDRDMNYRCCDFVGTNLGWAAGDEMHIARYTDSAWKAEKYLPSGGWELNALHMVAEKEGWAVGPKGAFLWYR